jgi:transposase
MSRDESRARAAEAFNLRIAQWSWREIMRKLDYRSVGATSAHRR